MALQTDLMGAGIPDVAARLLGNTPATFAGAGTAQTGATTIRSSMADLTTAGGATAFVMSSTTSITRLFFLCNTSSTTALIYPPSGGAWNNGSTDAAFSLAQNKTALAWRFSTNVWRIVLTA